VTLQIIKADFKGDWSAIKHFTKEKFISLRERIENRRGNE